MRARVYVCVCDELVAVRSTYTDRGISLLCVGGERGGLWRIINHLCEGQTKTGTRKCEILFVCVYVCVCVCVCVFVFVSIRGNNADDLHGAESGFSPPHPSSIFLTFRSAPPPPPPPPPPHFFYLAFTLGSSSKGECLSKKKIKSIFFSFSPIQKKKKLIYSLYVSKILTPALTQYPRAAKHRVCQSRFHHPSVFFWEEYVEEETVGLNPAFCVVVGALLFCAVLRVRLFLYILWMNR